MLPLLFIAGWPDLRAPAAFTQPSPRDVAIEEYDALPPIPGAVANGNVWHTYFTRTLQLPPHQVVLLRNNEGTIEKIRRHAQSTTARRHALVRVHRTWRA